MTWFDNISDLQYYNQPKGLPCYCEHLILPTDLILQGFFPKVAGSLALKVEVYKPDGLTVYEDISSYCSTYFANNPITGEYFFTSRLETWPDSICTYKCFIIKATVTALDGLTIVFPFTKYTERYCQSECCDEARGVIFEQDGFVSTSSGSVPVAQGNNLYTECGDPLIRIISNHTCYDPFAKVFYGTPTDIISGDVPFPFVKISTIKGRIVRRQQEITREVSLNCRLQRVVSTPQYYIEGFDYLPTWKMLEINAQFAAKEIYVDDYHSYRQYQYSGGTPLKQVNRCYELFKLDTFVQECEVRRIYGCDDNCGTPVHYSNYQSFFIVPSGLTTGFYDDNKVRIADDVDGLVDYIRTRDGITATAQLAFSPELSCNYTAVIGFSGERSLPNSIYYNSPTAINRIFAVDFDEASEVCDFIPVTCPVPVVGDWSFISNPCATPSIGTITIEMQEADPVDLEQYGNWEFVYSGSPSTIQGTSATVFNNQVTLSMLVRNYSIVPTPGEVVYLSDEIIGVIYAEGRPLNTVALTSANSNLPESVGITIDSYGVVRFSGETTSNEGSNVEISFTNLVYNI